MEQEFTFDQNGNPVPFVPNDFMINDNDQITIISTGARGETVINTVAIEEGTDQYGLIDYHPVDGVVFRPVTRASFLAEAITKISKMPNFTGARFSKKAIE